MGPGPLSYLWLVIRTAWRHSFHAAHSVILALIILAGTVTYFVPQFEVMVDLHGWQVATFVLGSIIAVRILLAPYWIWKSDQHRLATLGNQLASTVQTEEQLAAKTAAIDDIRVANAGHDNAGSPSLARAPQHPARYTELAPDRFKGFWRD